MKRIELRTKKKTWKEDSQLLFRAQELYNCYLKTIPQDKLIMVNNNGCLSNIDKQVSIILDKVDNLMRVKNKGDVIC